MNVSTPPGEHVSQAALHRQVEKYQETWAIPIHAPLLFAQVGLHISVCVYNAVSVALM
jgi:hypothetical protein